MVAPTQTSRPAEDQTESRFGKGLLWAVYAIAAVLAVRLVSTPIRLRGNALDYVSDDFLYYLVIAKNLATGHGSTFNRILPTNGYQPLWEAILTIEQLFSPTLLQTELFIAICTLASGIVVLYLSRRLLRGYSIPEPIASLIAIFVAWIALNLSAGGMETILAIPSMLWFAVLIKEEADRSQNEPFRLGLVFSLTTLSRLDAGFFGVMLLGSALMISKTRKQLKAADLIPFLAGLIPLVAYLISNIVVFGGILPISGDAKQLRRSLLPSANTFKSLLSGSNVNATLLVGCLIAFFYLLGKRDSKPEKSERIQIGAMLAFPFVYYSILSFRSDWSVWYWYWYPLPAALIGATCAVKDLIQPVSRNHYFLSALALIIVGHLATSASYPRNDSIADEAVAVHKFSSKHPGIYAMGDRAGSIAYLLENPLIQLEGLVSDRAFLQNIREQRPLLDVLHSYGVRYYITVTGAPTVSPFSAVEPLQAGEGSPKMSGKLYHQPVFRFDNEGFHTLIFDLNLEPGFGNSSGIKWPNRLASTITAPMADTLTSPSIWKSSWLTPNPAKDMPSILRRRSRFPAAHP